MALGAEDIVVRSEVRCIVDNTWEINRLTRAKAGIIDCARKEALASLLRSILPEAAIKTSRERDARELADGWFVGPSTEVAVGKLLSEHDLKADHTPPRLSGCSLASLNSWSECLPKPAQNPLPYLPRKDGKEQAKAS